MVVGERISWMFGRLLRLKLVVSEPSLAMESIPINELFEHLDRGLEEETFGAFLNLTQFEDKALPKITEEGLYQERLQSLIDSQLREIKTFAGKEGKNCSEVLLSTHS